MFAMTYVVRGLDPEPFQPLFDLSDDELAERGVVRMTVTDPTYPCRVSLTDRALGETVLLVNHVSSFRCVPRSNRASHCARESSRSQDWRKAGGYPLRRRQAG